MPIIPPDLLNLPTAGLNYTITRDGIKKEYSPTLASLPCSVVIGASRGIGLEFVRQLLERGHRVIAAVRDPFAASQLWPVATGLKPGRCMIQQCDVTSEESIEVSLSISMPYWPDAFRPLHKARLFVSLQILGLLTQRPLQAFVTRVKATPDLHLEYLILNAGVLHYPNVSPQIPQPWPRHSWKTLQETDSKQTVACQRNVSYSIFLLCRSRRRTWMPSYSDWSTTSPPTVSPPLFPNHGVLLLPASPHTVPPGCANSPVQPSRSFSSLLTHLTTNTIGPITIASRLLQELSPSRIRKTIFISSDSGSQGQFRDHEDGFAAYAASKAALNMMVRHLAAEVKRREDGEHRARESDKQRERVRVGWGVGGSRGTDGDAEMSAGGGAGQRNHGHTRGQSQSQNLIGTSTGFGAWGSNNSSTTSPTTSQYQHQPPQEPPQRTTILAIHPGEVATDMASNVELSWEVEGIIGVEESVSGVLNTVERLGPEETGSFWTWDGRRHLW